MLFKRNETSVLDPFMGQLIKGLFGGVLLCSWSFWVFWPALVKKLFSAGRTLGGEEEGKETNFIECTLDARWLTYIGFFWHWPSKIAIVSNLKMKKLRPREFKSNLLNVSVSEWQSWDLNPSLSGPLSGHVLFITSKYFPWVLFKYLNRKALHEAIWLHGNGRYFPSGKPSKQFVQKSQGRDSYFLLFGRKMCFVQQFLYIR